MGNAEAKPRRAERTERVLELRLATPQVQPPLGERGLPCVLFAQVRLLGDQSSVQRVTWDEPVPLTFVGDDAVIVVSIFAVDTGTAQMSAPAFVAEVCLPYSLPGGLTDLGVSAGGAVVPVRLAVWPGVRCSQATVEQITENFTQGRQQLRKDSPFIGLSVRELLREDLPGTMRSAPELPARDLRRPMASEPALAVGSVSAAAADGVLRTRRSAILLAFENAALDERRRALQRLGPEPDAEPEGLASIGGAPVEHMRQLELIQEENSRLQADRVAAWRKLEISRAGRPETQPAAGQKEHWSRALQVMQTELDHCRQRQRKIQASYEGRLRALEEQLMETIAAGDEAEATLALNPPAQLPPTTAAQLGLQSSGLALQAQLDEARDRHDDLQRHFRAAQKQQAMRDEVGTGGPIEKAAALPESVAARMLVEQGGQYKAELSSLQRELASMHEREWGSERQAQLRQQVQQLYDELDELQEFREDERVRSESEVRELRKERDAAQDRFDDGAAELRRLYVKAEALRNLGTIPSSAISLSGLSMPGTQVDLARLGEENIEQEAELERWRQCEEGRKATIIELERDQEMLVQRIGVLSSQAVLPDAEQASGGSRVEILQVRAADLDAQLSKVDVSCLDKRAWLGELRLSTAHAQETTKALKVDYDDLQRSTDERVMRVPQGAASGSAPVVA